MSVVWCHREMRLLLFVFVFFRGLPFFVLFLLVFFPRGLGFFDPFTSKNIGGFVCVLA